MNVLVTGCAGFIGSHLTEKLLQNGYTVIGLDNMDPYYNPNYKYYNLKLLQNYSNFIPIEGSFTNQELVKLLLVNYNIKKIAHLGARAGVRTSINLPLNYARVNIIGTLNLLELSRQYDIENFIFAGSSSVYGETSEIPFKEIDPCDKPESPYAATKRACEMFGYNYHSLYGLKFTSLRFFTVYGPRGRPDMAIFKFTDKISKGLELPLYGDGTASRDFTYVSDIVDGIYASFEKNLDYEIINLGNENPITIKELIEKIEQLVGKKALIRQLPKQKGDVKRTYADISKAKNLLGYNPKIDIEVGLSKFVEWYNRNKERF